MTPADLAKLTGAERLRLLVRNMDATRESFNDRYTVAQLVTIYTMQLLSEWDFSPDQWTPHQVREALDGYPPHWDDQEKTVYAGQPSYPHAKQTVAKVLQ